MNLSVIFTFASRVGIAVLNFVIAIIIAQTLGAEGKGEQGLILTTMAFVIQVMGIIGAGPITYLFSRMHGITLVFPSYLWAVIVGTGAYYILPLFHSVPQAYYTHISVLSVLNAVFYIHISLLYANEKIKLAALLQFFQVILSIGYIVYYFYYKNIQSIQIYVESLFFGIIPAYILALIYTNIGRISIHQIKTKYFYVSVKKMITLGFYNQIDIIAQTVSLRLSYYILDMYNSRSDVGVYSIAVSVAESLWLIGRSISSVQIVKVSKSRNTSEKTLITIQWFKLSLLLTTICFFVLLLIPENFYTFIFGKEFSQVKNLLIVLGIGICLFSGSFSLSALFAGTGNNKINAIASLWGMGITILLLYVTIPYWGVWGAAFTASISYCTVTLVKIMYLHKKFEVSYRTFLEFSNLKSLIKL
ncbi:MAG: polysaccharide biosynthesis C-terminal domain-containing protein [Bacteroidales bacterium]